MTHAAHVGESEVEAATKLYAQAKGQLYIITDQASEAEDFANKADATDSSTEAVALAEASRAAAKAVEARQKAAEATRKAEEKKTNAARSAADKRAAKQAAKEVAKKDAREKESVWKEKKSTEVFSSFPLLKTKTLHNLKAPGGNNKYAFSSAISDDDIVVVCAVVESTVACRLCSYSRVRIQRFFFFFFFFNAIRNDFF